MDSEPERPIRISIPNDEELKRVLLELRVPMMLSVWNLADDSEQELMLDPVTLSEKTGLKPVR